LRELPESSPGTSRSMEIFKNSATILFKVKINFLCCGNVKTLPHPPPELHKWFIYMCKSRLLGTPQQGKSIFPVEIFKVKLNKAGQFQLLQKACRKPPTTKISCIQSWVPTTAPPHFQLVQEI
jgi:hypothetical protein